MRIISVFLSFFILLNSTAAWSLEHVPGKVEIQQMQQVDHHGAMQHDCCDDEVAQQFTDCCDSEACSMQDCPSASCFSYSASVIDNSLGGLHTSTEHLPVFTPAFLPLAGIEHPYRPPII